MTAEATVQEAPLVYAGFWIRVAASIIDTVLALIILWPILLAVYGFDYFTSTKFIQGRTDFVLNWILPAIASILFWRYRQATPGKMALSLRIVDAKSGKAPSTGQLVGRYFAYYLSMLGLFLGYVWVGLDPKKQGWHDKLAGTVVVRPAKYGTPVEFATANP